MIADAAVVEVRSISSGVYENGKFNPSDGSFQGKYSIDEQNGTIKIIEVTENNREGRLEAGGIYDITNVVISEGLSALLVSRDKKGQKIITGIREADLGATDLLILGEDFYEYCRAANGKFYLEYGEVRGPGRRGR
jgi:hypothetical protein